MNSTLLLVTVLQQAPPVNTGVTFSYPTLIASATFIVLAITFGRWGGRLQTIVENNSADVLSLRASRHIHGEKIAVLESGLETAQEDIGDLLHRRKGDKT